MKNRQIDKITTFQARIDKGWQRILLILRAKSGRPIKGLIEDALTNTYRIDDEGEPYEID